MNVIALDLNKSTSWTKLFKKAKEQYWLPQSVDLSTDKLQWPSLPKSLKKSVLALLRYAILLDSFQVGNVAKFASQMDGSPDLQALLSFHSMMEAVHSESYSYFAETVCRPKEKAYLYTACEETNLRLSVLQAVLESTNPINANYWLEAVAFQGLFRLADYLRSQELLPGLSSLIQLIAKDEELHVKTFSLLLTDKQSLLSTFESLSPLEGKLLAESTDMPDFEQYVKFISAWRLKGLGISSTITESWLRDGNPFQEYYHLNDFNKTSLKGNFFTSSLVYDTSRPDLDWEVENWFLP